MSVYVVVEWAICSLWDLRFTVYLFCFDREYAGRALLS